MQNPHHLTPENQAQAHFEEDLNISRVRLVPELPPKPPITPAPTCSPAEQERGRQRALAQLRQLKQTLR